MHTRHLLFLAAILLPGTASADLWITNFSTAAGGLASGVWRNSTTSTDLTIPVTLTQTGAVFDEETILDDTGGWDDFFGINVFEPNYTGDAISLEVIGGQTASVTIAFNAQIVNPVLHFTDVDLQTTMVFSNATPTQVAGTPNMLIIGNSVKPSGAPQHPALPNEFETLGSLQFNGTLTELSFQLVNDGPDPGTDDDRTAFSVSTTTEPVAAASSDELTIWRTPTHLHLSWPSTSSFTKLECSTSLTSKTWMTLPGSSPTTTTTWSAPFSGLGDILFIRGVY